MGFLINIRKIDRRKISAMNCRKGGEGEGNVRGVKGKEEESGKQEMRDLL